MEFRQELARNRLSWQWGAACLDAGNRLQKVYQKRGLEQARLDPDCDGYIYWTIVDVGSPSAQGLFDQFWEPKATLPADFRQFNGPTAILLKMAPDVPILVSSEKRKIEWWISHFDEHALLGRKLRWELSIDATPVASGTISDIQAQAGDVKPIAGTTITAPTVEQPRAAKLAVEIEGTKIANSWDWWIFPKREANREVGTKIAAARRVFKVLEGRYPGIARVGTSEALKRNILLTDRLDDYACAALDAGKTVLLLRLDGPRPGATLGWWTRGNQRGAAVAKLPAFGVFPHEGYLGPLFFRIINSAVLLSTDDFREVEPLMVGRGNDGYLAYVFQARAGKGRVFAVGLDVLAELPEASCLLDQFIAYVGSDRFQPRTVWHSRLPRAAKSRSMSYRSTTQSTTGSKMDCWTNNRNAETERGSPPTPRSPKITYRRLLNHFEKTIQKSIPFPSLSPSWATGSDKDGSLLPKPPRKSRTAATGSLRRLSSLSASHDQRAAASAFAARFCYSSAVDLAASKGLVGHPIVPGHPSSSRLTTQARWWDRGGLFTGPSSSREHFRRTGSGFVPS